MVAGAAGASRPQGQRALLQLLQAVPAVDRLPHELQRGEAVDLRRLRATAQRGRTANQQHRLQVDAQGDPPWRRDVQRRRPGRLRHTGLYIVSVPGTLRDWPEDIRTEINTRGGAKIADVACVKTEFLGNQYNSSHIL